MARARKELVNLESTPYYHVTCRCVRRAYLCGEDKITGQCFDHRKQWLIDRIKHLADIFSVDICAYAIMSNHYHLVLRIDEEQAKNWTAEEGIERWYQLFNGTVLVDRYRRGETKSKAEVAAVMKLVKEWRSRLCDLGWLMRCMNEDIARMANAEDNCKGRF